MYLKLPVPVEAERVANSKCIDLTRKYWVANRIPLWLRWFAAQCQIRHMYNLKKQLHKLSTHGQLHLRQEARPWLNDYISSLWRVGRVFGWYFFNYKVSSIFLFEHYIIDCFRKSISLKYEPFSSKLVIVTQYLKMVFRKGNFSLLLKVDQFRLKIENFMPVRDGHGGGWSRKINAWHLYTLMVYL
jgi:hypothetical protein